MLRQALVLPLALGAAANLSFAQQGEPAPVAPDGSYLVALRDPAATQPGLWSFRHTALQEEAGAGSARDEDSDEEEKGGFLYGLRGGFESKPRPIDSPLYFEDPYINTEIRAIYLFHTFPKASVLGSGDLQVAAVQARVALTDRIQFLATEDGYSWMDTDAFGETEGWNDITLGLKVAVLVDEENDFILSTGGRVTIPSGDHEVLKSLAREWSVFATAAKGFNEGRTNLIGNLNFRKPFDQTNGNTVLNWDLHLNTELFENFAQVLEIHGLHYLQDGDRFATINGGLDYTNIGATNAAGHMALWGTAGFRWAFGDHVSLGLGYGFPLKPTDENDLFESRAIANLNFRL